MLNSPLIDALPEGVRAHLVNVADNLQLIADMGYGDVALAVHRHIGRATGEAREGIRAREAHGHVLVAELGPLRGAVGPAAARSGRGAHRADCGSPR